jgi:hypothetical protein
LLLLGTCVIQAKVFCTSGATYISVTGTVIVRLAFWYKRTTFFYIDGRSKIELKGVKNRNIGKESIALFLRKVAIQNQKRYCSDFSFEFWMKNF